MSALEFLSPDEAVAERGFAPLLRSSLERRLREAGALFAERHGWLVATHLPGEERLPLRVRDVSHRAKIEVRGTVDGFAAEGATVVPLTPERALVLCEYGDGARLRAELRQRFRTITDLTAGLAGLELEGERADAVMRRLTDLDLGSLPAAGPVAHVPAVVLGGGERFELLFPQEYGHYLWEVVLDAAEPFGGGPAGAGGR